MSQALPQRSPADAPGREVTAVRSLRPRRRLHVAAAFYRDAGLARLVCRILMEEHRLRASQVTVLGPADRAPERYRVLSRRWTPGAARRAGARPWWQRLADWAAGALAWLPPRRHFDRAVQQRLAEGQWAVLVHGVARAQQAAVVADLRASGEHWCAEAPRQRRA